jgi:hypothetical protein
LAAGIETRGALPFRLFTKPRQPHNRRRPGAGMPWRNKAVS